MKINPDKILKWLEERPPIYTVLKPWQLEYFGADPDQILLGKAHFSENFRRTKFNFNEDSNESI